MTTQYPGKIDTNISLPDAIDNITPVKADVVNRLKAAILAIENELGTKPSGVSATVKARLSSIENSINSLSVIQIASDLGGTVNQPLVVGLQGIPISTTTPTASQTLVFNGLAWVPSNITGGGGGGGVQLPAQYELSFVAGLTSTTSSSFVRVGARQIDLILFPATIGSLIRTIKFVAAVDKTSGATSVEVQLYDTTHSTIITGTDLISTNNVNTSLSTTVTVGSSSGNLRSDVASQYEIQIKMNGGGGGDAVFLTNARLVITYV